MCGESARIVFSSSSGGRERPGGRPGGPGAAGGGDDDLPRGQPDRGGEPLRLENGDAELLRGVLRGRRHLAAAPPGRPVWAREQEGDVVAIREPLEDVG